MAQPEVSEVEDESEFDAAFGEFAEAQNSVDPDPIEEVEEDESDPTLAEAAEAAEAARVVDPYDGMTDDVKAKFKALEATKESLQHTIDSDAGRVRAFQLKVNGLENEIQTIRKGALTGPSTSQIADAMKGSDADWDSFTESYPDVASAIDKRMAAFGTATANVVEETLKPVKMKAAQDANDAQKAVNQVRVAQVAEVYPTWTTAVKTTEYNRWFKEQPHGISQLAESDDVRDAATLIGLYDNHLVASGKPSIKADPIESGVNEEVSIDGSAPTKSATKRAKQLADGSAIPSKKAGISGAEVGESEFDAAFKVFASKKERQRAQSA